MEKRKLHQVIFYTLTALLDNCGGRLRFGKGSYAEAWNDKDQVVWIKSRDGKEIIPAYDADTYKLQQTLEGWRAEHPAEFDRIILGK